MSTTRTKQLNVHYWRRYIRFIERRKGLRTKSADCDLHHILPKASDCFPEYKNLKIHTWNGIYLTKREHFVAHWILSKAIPNSSQTRTFYYMTNRLGSRKSNDYAVARTVFIKNSIIKNQDPLRRQKISEALKGKKKSPEHIEKLKGHPVLDVTREKLRLANMGKRLTDETKNKMSVARTGRPKKKNSTQSKLNIAASKCDYWLITPKGIYGSHLEASLAFRCTSRRLVLIYQNLDIVPRKKVREELNIYQIGQTYRELGFGLLLKDQRGTVSTGSAPSNTTSV